MKHAKPKGKPDTIIRTCKSEIHMYVHYEDDPEKLRQFDEDMNRVLRYVAKQGGWLDVLERRDAALNRLKELSAKLSAIRAKF